MNGRTRGIVQRPSVNGGASKRFFSLAPELRPVTRMKVTPAPPGKGFGPSLPISRLSCLLLLLPVALCLQACSPTQHLYGGRCCSSCPPGQEMRRRCTEKQDTDCRSCPDGMHKPGINTGECKPCTRCRTEQGSIVQRKCTKEEDETCLCAPGSTPRNIWNTTCTCPAGHQLLSQKCVPCIEGYYSREENQPCKQWTNCTSRGEEIEEAGSSTNDVKCSTKNVGHSVSPALVSLWVQGKATTTGNTLTSKASLTAGPQNLTTPTGSPPQVYTPGFWLLVIIILCVLLAISAAAILIFVLQRCQTRKGPVAFRTNGTQSCRIPIQEEQTDSASSLTKSLD
ncbi:tumor necrosis factor receptor superfamily member 4 isoform X2 [Ambystoma mexicanum]|uniref:tumor necrosis factor receptor superfamily member 4 isoform X2 n=1 Tax=Ambystoma mexicanum TaxID=8296 RepID=UPI0037E8DB49